MTSPALLVGIGGVCGALARYLLGQYVETATADTLAVNALGSLALGLLTAAPLGSGAALVVGVGFCGAFTTFSSFAVETVQLYEDGQRRQAVANAVGTLSVALVGVVVGSLLGASL